MDGISGEVLTTGDTSLLRNSASGRHRYDK
jgi:hypothetical protein